MDGFNSKLYRVEDKIRYWKKFRKRYLQKYLQKSADLQKDKTMKKILKKVKEIWYRVKKKSNICIIETQKERHERM